MRTTTAKRLAALLLATALGVVACETTEDDPGDVPTIPEDTTTILENTTTTP